MAEYSSSPQDYYTPLLFFLVLSLAVLFFVASRKYGGFNIVNNMLYTDPEPKEKSGPPFTILLRDVVSADLVSGLEFDIQCRRNCSLHMLWGVQTTLLAQLTLGEGILTTCYSSIAELFRAQSMSYSGAIQLDAGTSHRLIALPERGFELGAAPRKHIPLVLLCTLDEHEVDEGDIVTMVTVIHVKDTFCTEMTDKLNEIVNLRNGHWLPLNKYYSSGDVAAPGGTCVTCREGEVARLLLPCRHACLCDGCIAQMEGHCPMCGAEASSSVLI